MSAVGLIVEYNPLHNGHVHHYTRAKEVTGAEHAVAVLSGPFLQRGEPGIVSKYARAEMALAMGVDLVIELPAAYAVQPAEWFAYGAVALLNATGVVDSVCFGTESGTLEVLQPLARMLAHESDELQGLIAHYLGQGMSYPSAYAAAAEALAGSGGWKEGILQLLHKPNHTLGLHYLIALERLGSRMRPYTIPRIHAGYHDEVPGHTNIASATAVRRMLLGPAPDEAAPYLPATTLAILKREFAAGRGPITWESFRQPLLHLLLTTPPEQLAALHEVTEGLEHRLGKLLPVLTGADVAGLLAALKTKRYTHTKLQRMLVHILLRHSKEQLAPARLAEGPGYLRVLGFNKTGQALLKQMKKTASLPVVMKPSAFSHDQLDLDLRAAAAYANAYAAPSPDDWYRDYMQPPVMI
ncbi:nucleotidyltransferase [Paenibacillus favisporus]|uniref:nucleotidyltransferase n=1 Tax=Paenibacillus favisporus TaxID=221028 RepID=UPI0013D60573|nr:nucleotidyltransferase [Paenibacillus favisporus]